MLTSSFLLRREEQDTQRRKGARKTLPSSQKRFKLWYVGWSCLDRRTTLPMLPWLMAEIRRRSQKQEPSSVPAREVVLLLGSPNLRCIPSASSAANANPAVFIFEHKAQHISRFIHNSHDLTYFAYLIKAQPDNPESQMACHVFKATDPNQASGGRAEGQGLAGVGRNCALSSASRQTQERSNAPSRAAVAQLSFRFCNLAHRAPFFPFSFPRRNAMVL
uniref:PID domain-containing protein n=1 Tax=Salvator merianae TaxID=96440 RepID=A0A8D0DW27_SALMN